MGQGADDADAWAEAMQILPELRRLLNRVETGHIVWTARDGRKTKLKDMPLKRLRNIEDFLKRNLKHNDNEDWLLIIQNEIKNKISGN